MTRPWTLAALSLAGFTAFAANGCARLSRADDALTSIDQIAGPQERAIRQVAYEQKNLAAITDDPALTRGQALYDAAKYTEAEAVYRGILKKFATDLTAKVLGGGRALGKGDERKAFDMYGSAVEERAQFMLAESLFMQGLFPKASDEYATLLERYPSTRHLDRVTRRQFVIASTWLGFDPKQIQTGGDIELAGYKTANAAADPKKAPEKPSFFNATDKSRPTFDTAGRALQILRNIWVNDPTGPIADDALMLIGNFEYRRGDYIEAARHYEIMREQYPDSPHVEKAYQLEAFVRLASYDGPVYDAYNLERAGQLMEQSLVEFDLPLDERKHQQQSLNQIDEERVRREWAKVELYRARNKPTSVKLYCNTILNRFPESQYAPMAKRMLAEIATEERGGRRGWFRRAPSGPQSARAPLRRPQAPQLREEIPASLVPPSPEPQPQPIETPRARPLQSQPFPSQDDYGREPLEPFTPNEKPESKPSQPDVQFSSFDADGPAGIQQTAAVDDGVTLPTTNPFEQYMTDDE